MSHQTDITQIITFIMETDKLKGIIRKTRPQFIKRYENSAEHSWQVALAALMLQEQAAEPVNVMHVVKMLLIHDIGEIDAGDVIVYAAHDPEHHEAERNGIKRVLNLLPNGMGQEYLDLWDEFEEAQTAEAKFAKALDRALPMLHNLFDNGHGWRENGIHKHQVEQVNKQRILTGCPALWEYTVPLLDKAEADGWFDHT